MKVFASEPMIAPAEMPVEDCKRLVVCCGDSVAYNQITRYGNDEFDEGARLYYLLLVACKYPHISNVSCAVAENRLTMYMYQSASALRAMDDICRTTAIAILNEGISRKEWASAYYASFYYACVEADSAKYIECLRQSYSPEFRKTLPDFAEMKIAEAIEKWSNGYRFIQPETPSLPTICKKFPTDSLRQIVRCSGDTVSYNALIRSCRNSKNEYAFRECLFDAILMVCFYQYLPAKEHVCEILKTFYSEGEEPSRLFLQLLSIYES